MKKTMIFDAASHHRRPVTHCRRPSGRMVSAGIGPLGRVEQALARCRQRRSGTEQRLDRAKRLASRVASSSERSYSGCVRAGLGAADQRRARGLTQALGAPRASTSGDVVETATPGDDMARAIRADEVQDREGHGVMLFLRRGYGHPGFGREEFHDPGSDAAI